jgi:hypothetical protein
MSSSTSRESYAEKRSMVLIADKRRRDNNERKIFVFSFFLTQPRPSTAGSNFLPAFHGVPNTIGRYDALET